MVLPILIYNLYLMSYTLLFYLLFTYIIRITYKDMRVYNIEYRYKIMPEDKSHIIRDYNDTPISIIGYLLLFKLYYLVYYIKG